MILNKYYSVLISTTMLLHFSKKSLVCSKFLLWIDERIHNNSTESRIFDFSKGSISAFFCFFDGISSSLKSAKSCKKLASSTILLKLYSLFW